MTPDGQTVLALDRERTWRWYPVNGGASRLAAGLTAADGAGNYSLVLGWSADGKEALLQTRGDVPVRVDRLEIATGRRTLLTEIAPSHRTGLFNLTLATVSKDGRQYGYSYNKRLSTLFVVTPTK